MGAIVPNDAPDNVVNKFEIILHEATGDIELAIEDIQFDDVDDKVVGIENTDGTDGIEVIFVESGDPTYTNGDSVISNQGYCFSSGGTVCGAALAGDARNIPAASPIGLALLSAGIRCRTLLSASDPRPQIA